MNDVFEVADRIATLYLGRVAAEVLQATTPPSPVVELITAGRSGNIGLQRRRAEYRSDAVARPSSPADARRRSRSPSFACRLASTYSLGEPP